MPENSFAGLWCRMTDRVPKENREFVRANLSLHATLSPIDPRELSRKRYLKQILAAYRLGGTAGSREDSGETTDFSKGALSELAEFLMQMNDKIDRILSILEGKETGKDQVLVVETINISGSGLAMLVNQPLEVGQLVELSLQIPDFAMGMLRAHGKVIRSRRRGNQGNYEVGVRFLNLDEEERERLISFVFREQRKNIRKKKNYL